jgi:serine/threonine protein kinase
MKYIDQYDFTIEKLDIIRHLGHGAFSNVYLCEAPNTIDDAWEDMGDIQHSHNPTHFVIKEVNIKALVKKYLGNNESKSKQIKTNQSMGSVYITPYRTIPTQLTARASEYDYYYKRIRDLVESEIEVLKIVQHPNIIQYYSYVTKDDMYYLSMEYCEGGDVSMYRSSCEHLDGTFVDTFLSHVVSSIGYLHERNLIHRDIKLQNILLKDSNSSNSSSLTFKLTDFGFACYDLSAMEEDAIDNADILSKKYYKICGTPYYMAPEIVKVNGEKKVSRRKLYTKAVDIWSLGICIYELLTNKLPYKNVKNFEDLCNFFSRSDAQLCIFEDIRALNVDESLKDMLYLMLKINAKDRVDIKTLREYIKKRTPVESPVVYTISNTGRRDDSWVQLNTSESLMNRMNFDNGFMKWLFKKEI